MSNIVVTRFPPIIKSAPHTPLLSLSISIVICYGVTAYLLCDVLPSPCPPPTLCVLIVMLLFPLLPLFPPILPSPFPFGNC